MSCRPAFTTACGATIRPTWIGAMVLLMAVAWSDRAEGSCGDWLAGHGPATVKTAADSDDERQVPCSGPNCRRSRQDLPLAPSEPTRSFDNTERWCRLVEELAARPPLSSPLPGEAALVGSDGVRPSIERPPRL